MKFLPPSPETSVRFTKIHDCDCEILGMTGSRTAPLEPGARLDRFCPGRRVRFVEGVVGNGGLFILEPP